MNGLEKVYNDLIYGELSRNKQFENINILKNKDNFDNKKFVRVGFLNWDYQARVLFMRGYPKISNVIPELFDWIQDFNYPGAPIILNLISHLPREVLIKEFEVAVKKAIEKETLYKSLLHFVITENEINPSELKDEQNYYIVENYYSKRDEMLSEEEIAYEDITYNANNHVEKEKIRKLVNAQEYGNERFIQIGHCCNWEYQAEVLLMRGYPKVCDVIPRLFEWLQDMNWPGSMIIEELLLTFPREVLTTEFEKAVESAIDEDDYGWMYFLYLFALDAKIQESEMKNIDNYNRIKDYYINRE